MMKAALVVATCDRPRELRRLIDSLSGQTLPPYQVVVVDSGSAPIEDAVRNAPFAKFRYLTSPVRSASRQRNQGIAEVDASVDLMGFADDDVVFARDAFKAMEHFWGRSTADIAGAAFNMLNHPSLSFRALKGSVFSEALGLYSLRPGAVLPSGFHTLIGKVASDRIVEWLPTGAVLWRKGIFNAYRFDEWFGGYSYLEDLDLSYRIGRSFRLAVVADAGYYHYPAREGRGSRVIFGKREVLNRIHFVKKHSGLSLGKCYLALAVRAQMNLWEGMGHVSADGFRRAWGNFLGLWETLWD
jgi:GT2 family glycosyltransferase